jgi:hypothetical protein
MLRQRDDPSDASGAAALAPEDEGPAGSRNGGWRGASKWGWQGMAELRLTQLVVLGRVPYFELLLRSSSSEFRGEVGGHDRAWRRRRPLTSGSADWRAGATAGRALAPAQRSGGLSAAPLAGGRSGGSQLLHAERPVLCLGLGQIVLQLLVQPAFCGGAKRDRQADGHFGADTGAPVEDARQSLPTDAERYGCLSHAQVQRLQA